MPSAPVELLRGGVLRRVSNTALQSNSYLLAAPDGNECVVVDAGLDHPRLDEALAEAGWTPRAVLCTHGHFDHVGGAARLQATFGIPVYLHTADLKLSKLGNFLMSACRLPGRITLPEFTLLHGDAAVVEAAGREFTFHALPGHTPGSCGIGTDGLLFSGDTLYARRTGLSKLPGEDHMQLRASLQALFGWAAPETLVLPGHGRTATLADIRTHNEALRLFLAGTPVPEPSLLVS